MLQQETYYEQEAGGEWMCLNCGYIFKGAKVPPVCPVCRHERGYFIPACMAPYLDFLIVTKGKKGNEMTSQKIENVLNLALDATQESGGVPAISRWGTMRRTIHGMSLSCIPGHWIRWTGLRWMSSHC